MIFAGNQGWIGMDLGASRLKLAQVRRVGGRLCLAASAIVPRHASASNRPQIGADTESGGRTAAAIARQHPISSSVCFFNHFKSRSRKKYHS